MERPVTIIGASFANTPASRRTAGNPAKVAAAAAATFLLLLLLPVSPAAAAEPVFSFDATPGRLPKTVVPLHYAIELTPDLQNLTLSGREDVDIELREATAQLTLNAVNMTIASASIDDDAEPAGIALDAAGETATLSFPRPVSKGAHKLHVSFAGRINPFGRGLFFADYPTDRGVRRMIASHLEPADARRIFPCWDEPAFKASFALAVTVPRSFLAVSNMPVAHEEEVAPDAKRVVFAPTPKMSSYLFVLAAGELERVSADTNGTTVGVVTTAGKTGKGRFALDNAVRLLDWYNDYFGVRYPLPKLDLIAVPGGFGGAMENWGGIIFFESRLLFDPATDADSARRGIFSIIAHEMAHQWFGDLVTMGWWDNLWLNEGFASWMQEKAAEQLYPQWRTWLNGYGQKQFAMMLDARRTSHPIQQPVADQSEAMVAFDGITYSKGQAFIRMLENYLGEAKFRDGIRGYMSAHAFSNATTADLWKALEDAGGKDVAALAASFTGQDGVPLVIAETACDGDDQRMTLRQDRFAILPARSFGGTGGNVGLSPRRWQIPVAVGSVAGAPPRAVLLDGRAELAAGTCGEAIKVNRGDIGYYRVEYGPISRASLTGSLSMMAPEDRVDFLADNWALVQAGRADASSYFALVKMLAPDDRRAVWDQVISAFAALDRLARNETGRPALQAYMRTTLRPVFDRLGWDGSGRPEADEDALLRSRLIQMLGDLGDAEVIAEARRRFAEFLREPRALPVALRDAVAHVVGVTADRAIYDALLTLARNSNDTGERVRYYYAAASAREPALARDTLALALSDDAPSAIRVGLINQVAASGEQADLAWDFVRENLAVLVSRQGPSFADLFVPSLMTNFSDEAHADALAHFAPAQATSGGRLMTVRALEAIAISADLKARVLPAFEAWIGGQK
jgi:aminopeptidase N